MSPGGGAHTVLRNRRRVLGFVESPLDSFGPSFFKEGDLAIFENDRGSSGDGGRRAAAAGGGGGGGGSDGGAMNFDLDPLGSKWQPPSPRPPANLEGWLKETNPREVVR